MEAYALTYIHILLSHNQPIQSGRCIVSFETPLDLTAACPHTLHIHHSLCQSLVILRWAKFSHMRLISNSYSVCIYKMNNFFVSSIKTGRSLLHSKPIQFFSLLNIIDFVSLDFKSVSLIFRYKISTYAL